MQSFGILPFDPGAVFPECFILLSSFCLIAKLELGLPLKPESPSHLKGSLPHKTNLSFYIIESDAVVNQSFYLFSRRLFSTDEDDPEHSGLSCTMQEQDQEIFLGLAGKRWHINYWSRSCSCSFRQEMAFLGLALVLSIKKCVDITNTFGPRPGGNMASFHCGHYFDDVE